MKKRTYVFIALLLCALMLAGCGKKPDAQQTVETVRIPDGAIKVDNVDDFLAAIAPDAHIFLAPGTYDLSKAENYGKYIENAYIAWTECYDGCELVIKNVPNLTIEAGGAGDTVICTMPRYANVMTFNNCDGLSLRNITLGHVEAAGACSGGVVFLSECKNVSVEGCGLFGCGTIGVSAEYCEDIIVKNTKIYDCSYGAAEIRGCYDMQFDGCDIFDCNVAGPGLLAVENSSEIAFTNSSIHGNNGSVMLACSFSNGVYFGGNTVGENGLDGMFFCAEYPALVEKCELEKGNANWFYDSDWYGTVNMMVVSAEGAQIAGSELGAMERGEVQWTAKERAQYVPGQYGEKDEDGFVHVSTVDELLAAIAPGASIFLEEGEYRLSDAAGYGFYSGEYYRWQECFDGTELVISGVDGLTIMGEDADKVLITAIPRYANVINFEDCADLRLENFTAGHTEEPGSCTGGVIRLSACTDAAIEKCSLYGCGIIGVDAVDCGGLEITDCEIYDCSYCGVYLLNCGNTDISACDIYECGGDGIYMSNCNNAEIKDCDIRYNSGAAVNVSVSYGVTYNGTELGESETIF